MTIGGTTGVDPVHKESDHGYGSNGNEDYPIHPSTREFVRVHVHKNPFPLEVKNAISNDTCNKVLEFPYSNYFVTHAEARVTFEYPWVAWTVNPNAPSNASLIDKCAFGVLIHPTVVATKQVHFEKSDNLVWVIGEMRSTHTEDTDKDDVLVEVESAKGYPDQNDNYILKKAVLYSNPITLLPDNTQFTDTTSVRNCVVCALEISEKEFVIVRYFGSGQETVTCSKGGKVVPIATVQLDTKTGSQKILKILDRDTHSISDMMVTHGQGQKLTVASQGFYNVLSKNDMGLYQFRWVAALVNHKTGVQFCGASLVGSKHVLTARHCAKLTDKPIIRLGGLNMNNPSEFVERTVVDTIHHHATDAMLLVLDKPVTNVQPVLVNADPYTPEPGKDVVALGWGKTSETGSTATLLGQVTLAAINTPTCIDLNGAKFDTTYEMCAGIVTRGGKDSCGGDSGGPLVFAKDLKDPSTHVLVGITSYGTGCGRKAKAGVWVKVASIVPWLATHVPDLRKYPANLLPDPPKPPEPKPDPEKPTGEEIIDIGPINTQAKTVEGYEPLTSCPFYTTSMVLVTVAFVGLLVWFLVNTYKPKSASWHLA